MPEALRPVGPGVLLPSLGSLTFKQQSLVCKHLCQLTPYRLSMGCFILDCQHQIRYEMLYFNPLTSFASLLSFFETFFLFFVLVKQRFCNSTTKNTMKKNTTKITKNTLVEQQGRPLVRAILRPKTIQISSLPTSTALSLCSPSHQSLSLPVILMVNKHQHQHLHQHQHMLS